MNYRWHTACVFFQLLIIMTSGFIPEGENVPITSVNAVQSNTARMPCNVTPPTDDDKITLVIWYKDGLISPIYSYDARDSVMDSASHWSDQTTLNGRGFFEAKGMLAMFAIESVKNSDSGVYRCRVDFQKNPTRNSKVNLTVIIPPENVLILDDKGSHISHYIQGPYNEGAKVELTCVSTGGRPQPRLTWWRENSLLDDSFIAMSEKKMKNVLHLEKLERHHLHAQYTCQASNNNVTTPISSAVTLNLNLRPLWVKMQGENKALSAGSTYGLICEVVGSRPAPVITWWKGSILMKTSTDTTSPDGNTTTSILKFTPTIDDSGKYLSCRGEQPLIPDSGLESGWKLDIHHVPVVTLELGSNVNSTTIREGADVYFECNIKSNPWVYKVSWKHNGYHLYNNVASGIIVSNQSLVLQNVTRARSGLYTCTGSNEEGDGESNTMQLDIKFAPLCRPGQVQIYSIARHETAKIVCELESNPNDVHFNWKFNTSSAEMLDLPASLIAVDRAKSIAHYKPMTEQDYGTLLCWGSNDIGVQSDPCIFYINPAGKPDALSNCTVSNQTLNVLQLECIEGFDGGLPQTFEVEVFYARTKNLVTNQSSNVPFFVLKGLRPESSYDIVLTAKNAKGKSAETIHHMYTSNGAEKHTDEFPSLDLLLPYTGNTLQTKLLLGAFAGLVFGIMLILLSSLLIIRWRRRRQKRLSGVARVAGLDGMTVTPVSSASGAGGLCDQTLSAGNTEQSFGENVGYSDVALRGGGHGGSVDSIDKNPDIIPSQGKDESVYDDQSKMQWSCPTRSYATAAMTNQYSAGTGPPPGMYINYASESVGDHYQQLPVSSSINHSENMSSYATSYGSGDDNQNKELTYAELSLVIPKQKAIYTSATLGRPTRNKDVRVNEPTIYAQIDLAHGSPNGYPPVTWMAAPRQAHHMLQSHPGNSHHWQDEQLLMQQQQQRMPPIVSSKESSPSQSTLKMATDHRNSINYPHHLLAIDTTSHAHHTTTNPSITIANAGQAILPRF